MNEDFGGDEKNVNEQFSSEDSSDIVICPNCSKKLTKDDVFCNKCGTKLVQEPPKSPNCGFEYKKDEDVFCKKCGARNKKSKTYGEKTFPKLDLEKVLTKIIEFIINFKSVIVGVFFAFVCIGAIVFIALDYQDRHLDLDTVGFDELIYIDKNGREYFTKDLGIILYTPFREGRMFVLEPVEEGYSYFRENEIGYNVQIYELGLINKKGEVIANYKDKVALVEKDWEFCDTNNCYVTPLPVFYKGYARVGFIRGKTVVNSLSDIEYFYLNRNGDFVKRIPKRIKKILETGLNPKRNMFLKELPCEDGTGETCSALTDKRGRLKTKAIFATEEKVRSSYTYFDEFTDAELMYLNEDMRAIYVNKNGKNIYKQPFVNGYGFGNVVAEVIPEWGDYEDTPTYFINKKGKRVWAYIKPKFIYDIRYKKWRAFKGERLGNKYLDDCIYLIKDEYSSGYENPNWILDKDFRIMYEFESMDKFAGNDYRFDTDECILKNGRLFHYEIEAMKLYELVYNKNTNKLELVLVTDRKTISDYFKGYKILYISDFKNIGEKELALEVKSSYPNKFMIYNDVEADTYLFYRHYFKENPDIYTVNQDYESFEHLEQFKVLRPTTVYFVPDGKSGSWYDLKIVFK